MKFSRQIRQTNEFIFMQLRFSVNETDKIHCFGTEIFLVNVTDKVATTTRRLTQPSADNLKDKVTTLTTIKTRRLTQRKFKAKAS